MPRRVALITAALGLVAVGAQAQTRHGLDPANMDTTCRPCQDFNRYANGGWLARTQLDAQHASYGSFTELTERNQETLRRIVEGLAATAPALPTSNDDKVGAFYASCLDTAAAEAAGAKPLGPELARIAAMKTTADLVNEVARLHQMGRGSLFGLNGGPDFKNSTLTIVNISQGGLGLPDREFYFRPDSATAGVRTAYVLHVSRSLQLLGAAPATADTAATHIFALEAAIARLHLTRVQRRDPTANYHKMPIAAADSLTPHLEWRAFLHAAGSPATDSVNIGQPSFFRGLDSLLAATPIADWQSYLRWHYLRPAMNALSAPFVREAFSFQMALTGVKEQQPRWRRCLGATGLALGDPLGQAYVRETFTPAARARARAMVDNLIAALDDRLHTLEWMGDSTRVQALAKLRAFGKKIGYPDKWRDYSKLVVERGPYIENVMRAEAFAANRNRERIGKAVDRAEWRMTTPTVNATYSPSANDLTFPAGILQPPFFDPEADDAVNYGGMGAVIGHEMTHGFDDQGRQFDAAGNLRDWWTPEDAARFRARADQVARQFDAYAVVDSATHVNGRQTLGEDIADLGGLKIAYAAFQRSLAGKPRPPAIDGLTPEQRFFLAWAQIWRNKSTDQALRTQVLTDAHAPAVWRVRGPLSNLPEFAQAFGCRAGDPMVRPDSLRAGIW